MFNFRIIDMPDGSQVIDPSLKTPYNALTAVEMLEYTEMDKHLAYMDRQAERNRKEAERKRRMAQNPFYRLVCLCGLA